MSGSLMHTEARDKRESEGSNSRAEPGMMRALVDYPRKRTPWWSASGTALAADGTPLAFASGGPRNALRTIVCSNGVGVSTFFWDYVGEYFSRDHKVIVWDYRGHGASGRAQNMEALTMGAMADDLARILDANNVDA